jgi:hypothetical protein
MTEFKHTAWKGISIIYLIGLFLAISGCSSLFLLEGNWIYGTSMIYLLGVIFIWWSPTSSFNKGIALLIPAVIFTSVYSIAKDDRVREPSIWTVPEGYSGPVYVFLKEKCGEPTQQDGDYRVYHLDSTGIGFSAWDKNPGKDIIPSLFYYILPDGNKVQLLNFNEPGDTSLNVTYQHLDTFGQPVYAFPGEYIQGATASGKYFLDYAFIGSYRDFLAFNRATALPESVDSSAMNSYLARKANCK